MELPLLQKTGDAAAGKAMAAIFTRQESDFQDQLLQGVSRTFALTIPKLPSTLRFVVTHAYLLCRIIDTIEDEPALSFDQKKAYCERFVNVVAKGEDAQQFSNELAPLLSNSTIPAEHQLIRDTPKVININKRLPDRQRSILERCVRIMAEGMVYFQKHLPKAGLSSLSEMNRYCYHVAGVVGEMLTELYCHYSPEIARHHQSLMNLSKSFGQGLQMTNILKDIWEDNKRSVCWLPRDLFADHEFDLDQMTHGQMDKNFEKGLEKLVGIARGQLRKALDYTLMIPKNETGIRTFLFWNLGMAILTLRKISRNLNFESGDEVKISRRSVKLVAMATHYNIKSNKMLRMIFRLMSFGMPSRRLRLSK